MLSQGKFCLKCGQPRFGVVLTQLANYRAPPLQPTNVIKRVNKQLTPNPVSSPNEKEFKHPQYSLEEFKVDKIEHRHMEKKRRKAWAKFGSASGVDPAVLFPTEQEINEEITAEKTWWPSLQHMQANIRMINEEERLKKENKEQKIRENMAKMPKWIAEFEKEQEVLRIKEENMEEQKRIQLEVAQEKFGFEISRHHPSLLQFYEEDKERKKAAKRAEKKLKKLEKKKID